MARILIVDDDTELRDSTAAVLESHGYAVLSAVDGASGLAKARQEKPDLVLLDVMMKTDREGFEIARTLSADETTRHIPVIIVTGIRRAKRLPFGFEPDADWLPVRAVLEKPLRPEILLAKVKELLNGGARKTA